MYLSIDTQRKIVLFFQNLELLLATSTYKQLSSMTYIKVLCPKASKSS